MDKEEAFRQLQDDYHKLTNKYREILSPDEFCMSMIMMSSAVAFLHYKNLDLALSTIHASVTAGLHQCDEFIKKHPEALHDDDEG